MTYTAPSTKTLDRDHPLMIAQRELENEAIGRGTERYYAALEKSGEQNMPAGMLLIKRTVLPLAEAIKKWVEEARAGLALSKSSVSSFLQQFQMDDYQGCAWLVASSVIAMADSKHENTMQATAIELASRLEDMLNFDALRKADPRIYKILQQKISLQLKADRRHVVLHVYQKKAQVAEIRWGKQEKVRLGTVMLNLMEGLGIIQCVKLIKSGTNTPVVVQLTPEIESGLYDKNAKCALLSPRLMPMVVPPVPWDSIKGGGYYHHKLKKPLIKTYNHNYLEEMNNKEMPMVYKAINTLQETAWAVNSSVFTVMQQVWESGSTLGKLPPRFGAEIPPKTFVDGEADPDVLLAWKRVAAATHDQNIRDRAKRKSMSEKLWLAEKMGEFNRFYFTYTIDSRGRCYPAAEALSPQGDDSAKALLRFADTVSLGEEGRYWLAVHGANTFGYDKASFDARAAWTVENEEKILESAANPLDGSRWWAEADSPYQFLAFCKEWASLCLHMALGNPEETFESSLPVAWDGTCNGLQNFAAMVLDEVGGAAVGLVPQDKPADVYTAVKDSANELIKEEAEAGNEMALKWVDKLTRSLVKSNVMTTPYGVTHQGRRDQLLSAFNKLKNESKTPLGFDMDFQDATYLAHKTYQALGQAVAAAGTVMEWLKAVAKIAAANDLPVIWHTPSGLMVRQDYRISIGQRLDFEILGKRYQFMLQNDGDKLDKRKQSAAISPNFVHSLDAAHMMRTTAYCAEAGLTDLAMIHDSFGTHAGNAAALSTLLRRAFIDQYTEVDVLATFRDEIAAQLPEELRQLLPELPTKGSLNLEAIMDSDYFFA